MFKRNKNPNKGFREQKQQKPMTREKREKQMRKQGFGDKEIDYFFMLEDNAVIANTEFNKVCAMIERLGFKPQVEIKWHSTGADSFIRIMPIPIQEYEQRKARWEKEDEEKKKAKEEKPKTSIKKATEEEDKTISNVEKIDEGK